MTSPDACCWRLGKAPLLLGSAFVQASSSPPFPCYCRWLIGQVLNPSMEYIGIRCAGQAQDIIPIPRRFLNLKLKIVVVVSLF